MVGTTWQGNLTAHAGILTLVCAALSAACTGTLGFSSNSDNDQAGLFGGEDNGAGASGAGDGDGPGGDGDGVDPDVTPPPSCDTSQPYVSTSVVRRMTRDQYNRSILLLIGDDSNPADAFPVETREEGYDNQASSQHVQQPEVVAWETAATNLAARATEDIDRLLGCEASQGVDDCFASQFPALMRRLMRRTPSAEDVARYQDFYELLREEVTPETATELLVRALLLAPQFLFMIEEGVDWNDGVARLNGFEIATRLSFALWNQAPNDELLDAAEAGALETVEGVATAARNMINDDRAAEVVLDFHSQWIDLAELDNMVLPDGAEPELRDSARREIEWFINNWYGTGGLVPDLFTSRDSLVDGALADLYGIAQPQTGTEIVQLPEAERAGLLTRAVFLGTHGIPPTRGDFILARVLCTPVPALTFMPPQPPELPEPATTRQRFEKHAEDPCAAACHGILDPVGFAFEHFDHAGQWRDTENGLPIDSATELTLSEESGVNGPILGANDLSEKIATSPLATSCLSENWFRYSYGRGAKPIDSCSVEALADALGEVGDVRDLLVTLTQTDAFLHIRKEGL